MRLGDIENHLEDLIQTKADHGERLAALEEITLGEVGAELIALRQAIAAIDAKHNRLIGALDRRLQTHDGRLMSLENVGQTVPPWQRFAWRLAENLSRYPQHRPESEDLADWVATILTAKELEIADAHHAISESDDHPSDPPHPLMLRVRMMRASWGRSMQMKEARISELERQVDQLKDQLAAERNASHQSVMSLRDIDRALLNAGYGAEGCCLHRVERVIAEAQRRRGL